MTAPSDTPAAYLFGDSLLAAERLRLLAEVFAPSSRAFMEALAMRPPRRVLDLGCGPGFTTRLLAEAFEHAEVLGLDSSAHFVELAMRTSHPRLRFQVADVSQALTTDACDLIYARYLLTHLSNPETVIALWSQSLAPRGRIAIEENDWIRTTQSAFARYLSIVDAMLTASGRELYLGPRLAERHSWPLVVQTVNESVEIKVNDQQAARMFVPNLLNWRGQPFVLENYQVAEIDALQSQLEHLAAKSTQDCSITFGRRRLVLERTELN